MEARFRIADTRGGIPLDGTALRDHILRPAWRDLYFLDLPQARCCRVRAALQPALCVHRIECITRPIDDDQSAGQHDQLQTQVDRRKPT
jgi:hypothetical protein